MQNSNKQERDETDAISEDAVEYAYVNAAHIRVNKYEVRLVFGHRTGENDTRPVSGLVMTYLHAKELRDMLDRSVAGIEEVMGTIEDPTERISDYNQKKEQRKGRRGRAMRET